MKKLYLLRHGETVSNGRYVGITDCELSERGKEDIRLLSGALSLINFNKTFSSPLKRCLHTAELLKLSEDIVINPDIQEISFGRWENLTFDEIAQFDQANIDTWVSDPLKFTFPGGERVNDFIDRLKKFEDSTIQNLEDGNYLLITHGGVIRFLLCILLNIPLSHYMSFAPKPGCYSVIDVFQDTSVLNGFNLSTSV